MLYLIPVSLSENVLTVVLPQVKDVILQTNYYFVENLRTARRFIGSLQTGRKIDDLHFFELDKSTSQSTLADYFAKIPQGENIGVMSEAGCPAVADPGSLAVAMAHKKNIQVVPLVGASSILLALMGSGFNGQQFAFLGYLPISKAERIKAIQQLEKDLMQKRQTQIFIETPFRNNHLFADLCATLHPDTQICIAVNLTAPDEMIKTKTVLAWRKQIPELHKLPVVFVVGQNGIS
jgi:16S rRNA (cytidine1402-2'-O)-methyltransferase